MFGRFSALWKAEFAKWPESQRKVCNTAAFLCESSLESKQLGVLEMARCTHDERFRPWAGTSPRDE